MLFVNELMADNTVLPDPDEPGAFEDWIEIYNPNATAVDMGGLHLTDNLAGVLEAKGACGVGRYEAYLDHRGGDLRAGRYFGLGDNHGHAIAGRSRRW